MSTKNIRRMQDNRLVCPPHNMGSVEPWIVIPEYLFTALLQEDPGKLESEILDLKLVLKWTLNYLWDNDHTVFKDSYGAIYKVMLIRDERTTNIVLDIWDLKDAHVGSWTFPNKSGAFWGSGELAAEQAKRAEMIDDILKTCRKYSEDKFKCSKCTEWFEKPWAGSFYAGRYCTECWEGGVKQEEAKENYD